MSLPSSGTLEAYLDAPTVKHATARVGGIDLFYREAGPPDAPVVVLLHGFPSSSRMFATLIPLLASGLRVIAPDYPGFGHSDAPSPRCFAYTFDHLADSVRKLLDQLGVGRCALYLQDYGGPVGFRLAASNPQFVTALVIQNAVAHIEGLSEAWDVRKAFWADRAAHEPAIREAMLSPAVARQRHLAGVLHPENIDPDTWAGELAFLLRPGMADIQLELAFDYQSNVAAYPSWQSYLRQNQPPVLVVWGRHDPLFTIAGALAFGKEVPSAEIHLLNAGHFALDEEAELIAGLVRRFLARSVHGNGRKAESTATRDGLA